ncbi:MULTISPECIES: hypothetical protein [unclassified Nonomuraea]|uniref:hypothetical protein n=1 Tax=unclassified Nonomuraea TaxID=2593643 RepID=UPI0035BF466C
MSSRAREVFSATLDRVERNSTLVTGDLATEARKIKQLRDTRAFGSGIVSLH